MNQQTRCTIKPDAMNLSGAAQKTRSVGLHASDTNALGVWLHRLCLTKLNSSVAILADLMLNLAGFSHC